MNSIAMYRAKRAGRRQVMLFDDSMRAGYLDRMELDRDIRLALDSAQFEMYLQPLVYFGRGIVQNFEALIRWNHSRHGVLAPREFLPAVEQNGLTNALGEWAFARCAEAAASMCQIEPRMCIGVNVHPDQLLQPGFVASVIRVMAEADIPGDAMTIEIIEHAVMIDVGQTRRVLEELRSIGLSIAIDDFGTGYSNLDLLRRLPVDYIKIDRSFVAGLGTEPGDTQLVRMVLGLSQELGIEVIAEGGETAVQANVLRELGCRIGQGSLYSPPLPLPLAEAEAMLRQQAEAMLRQQANPPSSDRIVPVI
ncbi:MAG: EAL domain-containing protein [Ilumatobacteraceae bacterium]